MRSKKVGGIRMSKPVEVELAKLNFATYNPRTISAEKMRALKASLVKHGFVLNLVVQRSGLTIIGGHQRVRAMRELCKERGWQEPKTAWAAVLDVDDATAKQLNVTLNNVEGEFDAFRLGELYAGMIDAMSMDDVLASGFSQDSLKELVALTSPAVEVEDRKDDTSSFAKSITLSVEFDTVENRDKAKALLVEEAKATGKKSGTVLLRALRAAALTGKKSAESRA